jgi:outer membrane protein OmpA-like peptidoglycan-associated protein
VNVRSSIAAVALAGPGFLGLWSLNVSAAICWGAPPECHSPSPDPDFVCNQAGVDCWHVGQAYQPSAHGPVASTPANPVVAPKEVIELFLKEKDADKLEWWAACTVTECRAYRYHYAKPSPAHFDILVNFSMNSVDLTEDGMDNIRQLAKALQDPRLKGERFEIDVYNDTSGDDDFKLGLSERRAIAVVAYLAMLGMDPSLLIPKGFGKSEPRIADPFSHENRRVEVRLAD